MNIVCIVISFEAFSFRIGQENKKKQLNIVFLLIRD